MAAELGVGHAAYRSYEPGESNTPDEGRRIVLPPLKILIRASKLTGRPIAAFLGQEIGHDLTEDEWTLLNTYRGFQWPQVKENVLNFTLAQKQIDEQLTRVAQEHP
jgi:hypothetical protein